MSILAEPAPCAPPAPGVIARQPHLHAGIRQRFDHQEQVGRTAARKPVTASSCSSQPPSSPTDLKMRSVVAKVFGVAFSPAAIAVAPAPTRAGVLGMTRTIKPLGGCACSTASGTPAAT